MSTAADFAAHTDQAGEEPPALAEHRGNVAIIRLNRPRAMNSVNSTLSSAVGELLEAAAA